MANGNGINKTALIALIIVIVAVTGILFWWLSHKPQPVQDCSFTGWKRTVGVDLDTQVQELNNVKGKLGISDSLVRDYDTLMKDYALKYDSACQDVTAGRMSKGEYSCLRQNMLHTLDDIRTFNQAVEAAKTLSDPTAQKGIIQKAFTALEQASKTNYRLGCTSSMAVNPKTISFTGDNLENFVEITNSGNNDFNFSVAELPAAFRPHPPSGKLSVSGTAALVIERSFAPVPPKQPIKFLVRTNLNDIEEISITVDEANQKVWQRLGKKLKHAKARISINDAVKVVNESTSSRLPEPDIYYLASTLLLYMGESEKAKTALNVAATYDAAGNEDTDALLLRGIIANREQQSETALKYLAQAKQQSASKPDEFLQAISDLGSGIISFNLGKRADADRFLRENRVQKEVRGNPLLLRYGSKEFCKKGLSSELDCEAFVNERFAGMDNLKGGG